MVLLVIDTQKGITDDRLYEFEKLKSNIKDLIALARENNKEVIFVQHDDGPGTGFSVGDEAELAKVFMRLIDDEAFYAKASETCRNYLKAQVGATESIIKGFKKALF